MRTLVFSALLLPLMILSQTPKLVVGVVVDQMCYDYLYRFNIIFKKMVLSGF